MPFKDRLALARRRFESLNAGGLSEIEAVQLIRDCDVPDWSTAREIVDRADLPQDRTYRRAWRRSFNGGPIYIDEAVAREIDIENRARAILTERDAEKWKQALLEAAA
jgi:hypothetical protein